MVLLGAVEARDDRLDLTRDSATVPLALDGYVDRGGAAVLAHQRAANCREPVGRITQCPRGIARAGRLLHQPAEAHHARTALLDVVDRRERQDLLPHDPLHCLNATGELVDAGERGRCEDAVRVGVVHDPDHQHVVERKIPLHCVVQHAGTLVRWQHVLGVGVDYDPRQLATEAEAEQRDGEHHDPRPA